jgi:methyltransferase-like protein
VNLRGGSVALHEVDRLILPLLDGTRDRADVIEALASSIADGSLQMNHNGRPVTDPAEARAVLAGSVEESLRRLALQAMFLSG